MMMNATHQAASFSVHSREGIENRQTQVAVEAEIMLSVNGVEWLSFHCSPDAVEALAAGFLFNGGFIQSADEIASISLCDGQQNVDVWLQHAAEKPLHWSRTSGCMGGVVQSGSVQQIPFLTAKATAISEILQQVDRFLSRLVEQDGNTEGVHTSMLFDRKEICLTSDDIGRHNTLDKIAGDVLLKRLQLTDPVLMTTGRVSSEMVNKAVRIGAPYVVSLHSTSSMAVEAAEALGVTLMGHARRGHVEVYTHAERIVSG